MKPKLNQCEENLKIDLNELSSQIVHDFYVLCRKAVVYSTTHPITVKAIEKPFLSLQKFFAFKYYFSLYLTGGKLFANNILMTDTSVVEFLKDNMQDAEVKSILIGTSVSADDLLKFVGRLSEKHPTTSPDYHVDEFLSSRKIDSILVNHKLATKMFETGLRYKSNIREDFSVRRIVANYFSGEIDQAITFLSGSFKNTHEQAEATGIDYHPDIISFILPEKFAQLQPAELIDAANNIFDEIGVTDSSATDQLARFIQAFDYHPKRDMLLQAIQHKLKDLGIDISDKQYASKNASGPNPETIGEIDRIKGAILADNEYDPEKYNVFYDAFMRLLRTRQTGKIASLAEDLVEYLAADEVNRRRHAIYLISNIIKSAINYGDHELLDVIIRKLQYLFTRGQETFEFSEITVELIRSMLALRRYEPVAGFLKVIRSGRKEKNGITVYDSITLKKIFDDLDNRELIQRIVQDLQIKGNNQFQFIREILISLHSEEAAFQLAEIVAHPDRTIRKKSLKILSELGKPAVRIFSEILRDEANFYRPEDCYELPDKKWFLVRNAIFVLGNLADPEACDALRLRLSDSDTRVRRELVRALEKIPGDDSADLLMIMCEDVDAAVREAAIIALGIMKRNDMTPFFIDLLQRQKTDIGRIINAMALTGSEDARKYLATLVENKQQLKELSSGKASVDDIYSYIIKALDKLGDDESLNRIHNTMKAEKGSHSQTGEFSLGKTAKVILNKIHPKK